MSIASRAFLAATLAAGLMVSGGAHAAQGFSIDLGDPTDPLTLDWSAAGGLSAEVAASNGQPAQELPNNGSYKTTLTGNYDVVDDLGSLDKTKPVLWRESWELTLNGHVIFDIAGDIVGHPRARTFGSNSSISSTISRDYPRGPQRHNCLPRALDSLSVPSTPPGEFDYIYNTVLGTHAQWPCNIRHRWRYSHIHGRGHLAAIRRYLQRFHGTTPRGPQRHNCLPRTP